ncbi:MAG TPA: hypothetical protein VGM14_05405 [Streptosporangiaceae bacterium]
MSGQPSQSPDSWERRLGLGPDLRPTAHAREVVAVRLYPRRPGPPAGPARRSQQPPEAGPLPRLAALLGSGAVYFALVNTPWAALLPPEGWPPPAEDTDLDARVRAATGLTAGEAAARVQPVLGLFDDPSIGLADIGRSGFQALYPEVAGFAELWRDHLLYDDEFTPDEPGATDAVRRMVFDAEEIARARAFTAALLAQVSEAAAVLTAASAPCAVLFETRPGPRFGWTGWLAGLAEHGRAVFASTASGFDPAVPSADPLTATLIGDAERARASFAVLAEVAEHCYDTVPGIPDNPEPVESHHLYRTVQRFTARHPAPAAHAAVLVGEIALLQALLPQDTEVDRVAALLGFPIGPRRPWSWRSWLDQLSAGVMSELAQMR